MGDSPAGPRERSRSETVDAGEGVWLQGNELGVCGGKERVSGASTCLCPSWIPEVPSRGCDAAAILDFPPCSPLSN